MNKKHFTSVAVAGMLLTSSVFFATSPTAQADQEGISGSTAWGPCNYYTSENVRSTSVKNKQVRARLDSVGKLGVKMRTKAESTGQTSADAYFPADGFKNLGKFSNQGTKFRLQFTCVNTRRNIFDRPSTDFQGTLDR